MSKVHQLSRVVLTIGLVGMLSGYAWAAGRSDVQQNNGKCNQSRMNSRQHVSAQVSNMTLERTSHLIGHTVKGSDGKTLGGIYDVVLTPDLNSVSYVALSRGGAFGLGRDLYAVPWSAFNKGPGNTYYLPITENQLVTMQGFTEAYWPSSPSAGWVAEASNMGISMGRTITRDDSRDVQHFRVSKVIGINVKDVQGQKSGDIRDFVIAKDSGQIVYTIVSSGGFFGLGARYAPVPPTAIHIEPQRGVARLTVDRSTLVASAFSPMQWPDLASPTFEQHVATLYGTQPPSGAILGYVPPESSVPPSNGNVQPKAKMHGTKESKCEQGSALGCQAPAATPQSPGTATHMPEKPSME